MQRLIASIVFSFVLLIGSASAYAAKKVALVIGNAAYEKATVLKNPRNDAEDLSKKLTEFGFEVHTGLDLGHRAMRRTVEKYLQALNDADIALFFYAGHALQVSGQNYLMPVDAELKSHLDLNFETIPIRFILSNMEQLVKTNIVFLDACRDNPLTENLSRSMGTRSAAVGQGLASIGTGVGTLVGFATEPGNVALDGDGRNSPYTKALLDHLGAPGEDITRNLVNVRNSVLSATKGKQVPWEHSSLTGEIILQPKAIAAPKPIAEVTAKPDPTVELAYWDSIKDANTKVYFETYVKRYPDGLFKDIALLKIAELAGQSDTDTTAATEAKEVAPESKTEAAVEPQVAVKEEPKPEASVPSEDKVEPSRAEALNLAKQALSDPNAAGDEATSTITATAQETEGQPEKVEEADIKAEEAEETKVAALDPAKTEPVANAADPEIVDPKKDQELVKALQGELNRLGCNAGRADGIWGRGSQGALQRYNDNAATKLAAVEPSKDVLEGLKAEKVRVCPLTCRRGFEVSGDRCVRSKRSAAVDPKPKAKAKKAVAPRNTKRRTPKRKVAPRQTPRKQQRAQTRWCYSCPQTVDSAAAIKCFKKKQPNVMQDGRFCRAI